MSWFFISFIWNSFLVHDYFVQNRCVQRRHNIAEHCAAQNKPTTWLFLDFTVKKQTKKIAKCIRIRTHRVGLCEKVWHRLIITTSSCVLCAVTSIFLSLWLYATVRVNGIKINKCESIVIMIATVNWHLSWRLYARNRLVVYQSIWYRRGRRKSDICFDSFCLLCFCLVI